MIPRFIHEQLIDNCDILVEKFKRYEKIKSQNNMETKQKLKAGDKIVCITNAYKDFTIGKEYEIFEINEEDYTYKVINDYGIKIDFIFSYFDEFFKLKGEKETAYKETEGKLFYELDFEFITQMAERMASNKGKYEPYNWQKLDNIDDLKQSLFRHVLEVMNGNYKDDNREFGHLEAVAINAMFINYQLKRNEVSPSTKINTTDSTGLLTKE